MRIGLFFTSIALLVGSTFGIMLAAYGLAGFTEDFGITKFGIHGLSGVANMAVIMLAVVMIIATLLTMAERKWSALIQNRIGPNRITVFGSTLLGLPHIVPDVVKLLTKELVRPRAANKVLFSLAPMLAFAPVFALFAVVPSGPTLKVFDNPVMMVTANPDFGILYMFAIASLAVYGTALAGWASNNKFALLGGVRASSQLISYEVALGLSLVGMMMAFSTVRLAGPNGIAEMQGQYLWSGMLGGLDVGIPMWGVFIQPLGCLLFFAASFAETKRAPFDAPEGESEIVGYFLEYSGMQFGLFMVGEFVEVVILAGTMTTIFFGAWHLPFGNEALTNLTVMKNYPILLGATYGMVFWLKVVFLIWIQMLIRWTFPRFRYDQIQNLGWKILLPIGLANVFITGALILVDPSLRYLAMFGFVVIGFFVFLTMTSASQVRREEEARADAHGHGGHGGHDNDHGHGHAALPANTH